MSATLKGGQELINKLNNLANQKDLQNALKAGGMIVKSYLAEYPRETSANSSGSKRWYERGYGPKWRRADNTVGGRRTSETLGKRWTVKVSGFTAKISNNASYVMFVQSDKKQARFHRDTGWRTDKMAIEEVGPQAIELIRGVIRAKIR